MNKLEKNRSIINSFASAFDIDRDKVESLLIEMIENNQEVLKFSVLAKKWNKTVKELGTSIEGHKDGLKTLDRKYWSKTGTIYRRMSLQTFLKDHKQGTYLLRLDKEMITIKSGIVAVGEPKMKSGINQAFKII